MIDQLIKQEVKLNYHCRHCNTSLKNEVIDLGHQPPSNNYLEENQLSEPENYYPLKVFICEKCWLMQLPAHTKASELFREDYAYFSSTSISWCLHAKNFVNKAIKNLKLSENSKVVEIASNDGYLLQYFQQQKIPCIGIEPTKATAKAAIKKGINTIEEFFSEDFATKISSFGGELDKKADLIIANNVLAHVPDINDFLKGIKIILKETGRVSIEFPHLLELIKGNQFDTIYHEHFSYLSLLTLKSIVSKFGLEIELVEKLKTHGGSLRVWLTHKRNFNLVDNSVQETINEEIAFGLNGLEVYKDFQNDAISIKNELNKYLLSAKDNSERIIGYGAAAKGNTLINFAGIKKDLINFVADKAPSKQGKFLPGSHIPIINPKEIKNIKPDRVLILPWNLLDELKKQMPNYKLFTAIPKIKEI